MSCWHASEHESDAMWRLYAPGGEGVAIQTTAARLTESMGPSDDVLLGSVKYVDYDQDVIPERNIFSAALHKRRSFEHEREVRALLARLPEEDRDGTPIVNVRREPDFLGEHVSVKLDVLIEQVRIAPTAPSWFADAVRQTLKAFAVNLEPAQSDLIREPVW